MVGTDLKYVYLPYIYRLGNRDFHNLKFVAGYLRVPGQRTPTFLQKAKISIEGRSDHGGGGCFAMTSPCYF